MIKSWDQIIFQLFIKCQVSLYMYLSGTVTDVHQICVLNFLCQLSLHAGTISNCYKFMSYSHNKANQLYNIFTKLQNQMYMHIYSMGYKTDVRVKVHNTVIITNCRELGGGNFIGGRYFNNIDFFVLRRILIHSSTFNQLIW